MLDTSKLDIVETAPPALADPASGEIVQIPLDFLMLSSLNVRRTERDADCAALAEDIAARGLKQNLVVIPAHFSTGGGEADWPKGAKPDRFEVVAGGRRFQALRLLAEAGRLPADHPVPCLIDHRDQARETSLSENLQKVAMNPADEFEAFAAIIADTASEADPVALCAKRFGVTRRHVEGRLRLAALAPDVLEALRSGAIGLDSAKAYALTTDHALQLAVFTAQGKTAWKSHDPRTVRDALRGHTLGIDDGRVIFATLDAYRAAGGRSEHEMFMGTEGTERLLDLALLDQLCADKAAPLLAARAAADGYASALFAPGCGWNCKLPKPPKGFVAVARWSPDPDPAEQQLWIAAYTVEQDGSTLRKAGHFKPDPGEAAAEARRTYVPETEEQRAARLREHGVALWSARMAVGKFTATPLEGKAFWPLRDYGVQTYEERTDENDEPDGALVAILIRVDQASIAACRAEGEAKYDEVLAEQAEREAARQAGGEAEIEEEAAEAPADYDDEDEDA